MRIVMLATALGAEEGFRVSEYQSGREYVVGEALGHEFIRAGLARVAETAPAAQEKPKRKAREKPADSGFAAPSPDHSKGQ